jgi:hypothetical protein
MVRTFPDPVTGEMSVAIDGLKSWSSSGWQGTLIYSAKAGLVYEPDIAISDDGTTAYLAMTSFAGEQVWAWGVNLTNGNVSSHGTGSQANLPPRIAYDSDLGDALLLDVAAVKVAPAPGYTGVSYNPPIWKMFRIHYDSSTNTVSTPTDLSSHGVQSSGFEGDAATRLPFSDYDFDCQRNTSGTDNCVVAAILEPEIDSGGTHHPFGSLRSIEFSVASSTNTVTFTPSSATWEEAIDSTNKLPTPTSAGLDGVIGVTISSSHLYVITGRVLQGGSDTDNTRVSEFSSTTSVASGTTTTEDSSVNLKDDVENGTSCVSHSDGHTQTTSAASQHGGYSAAWCPSCGTTGGTLEGLAMLAPSDGFCF